MYCNHSLLIEILFMSLIDKFFYFIYSLLIQSNVNPDDDVEHRNLLVLLTTCFIDLQIESRRE